MMRSMAMNHLPKIFLIWLLVVLVLSGSIVSPGDSTERVRAFTRAIEFDYLAWTLNAFGVKIGQLALGVGEYLSAADRKQIVLDYLELVRKIQQGEGQVSNIYADPLIEDPEAASIDLRLQLEDLRERQALLEPLAEQVLQIQISVVTADFDLSLGGQPIPPVLFRTTPPPDALIISPREVIRQDANISIRPDLTIDQISALEDSIDRRLGVSSLVVGIGGIGLYPTMVMQTTDINWLTEIVAHEWIHNYLTLRPLGINYLTSPELRTMNETVASIAGKEIGRAVVERFYPEFTPQLPEPSLADEQSEPTQPAAPEQPLPFDYRAEMRETRVQTDRLLAEGEIEAAETYLELRRRFFWDNGYRIRKLNQAYFAFYGAYADEPGGAAGADPVGAAVRTLRAQTTSLAEFIDRIAWMWSFEQLQRAVERE
jgi:hypothetical protein